MLLNALDLCKRTNLGIVGKYAYAYKNIFYFWYCIVICYEKHWLWIKRVHRLRTKSSKLDN